MTVDEPSEFNLAVSPPGARVLTEEEWCDSSDCLTLIRAARDLFPGRRRAWWGRKARLAACGCFRSVWDLLTDVSLKAAVEAAEGYADGLWGFDRMQAAREEFVRQSHWLKSPYVEGCAQLLRRDVDRAVESVVSAYDSRVRSEDPAEVQWARQMEQREAAARLHADIARDIFGNPFRPVTFDPSWRTSTAVAIARQMYESRDFGAMPILADALQDAGCENAAILDHCRSDKPHVRGCWVADLVLEKP
jgi:hypothetical protein